MTKKQRIFSAIQPSGELHIGNYLGALKNFIALQNEYDCFFFIADYHSISGEYDPKEKKKQIMGLAKDMVAAFEVFSLELTGKKFDSSNVTIAIQSQVPEHTELAWILNTITPLAELQRMTQFKDKSQQQDKNINMGLLDYPVLQSADILMYKSSKVPVGQDQIQHIELTRKIARFFNNKFGKTFPEPQDLITETPKIMSLTDPTKKMSKSSGPKSYIGINDEPEVIMKKMRKAVSVSDFKELLDLGILEMNYDNLGHIQIKYIEGNENSKESITAAHSVINFNMLLENFGTDAHKKYFTENFKNQNIKFSGLKDSIAEDIANYFQNFREKRKELEENPKEVEKILTAGAQKARVIAKETMKEVKEKIGVAI
ncbi:tryptophan--tRNA ligase [Candidatus Parcubacteria bacterium]|nr:tryptophan--tRNA ligase [Candidatus Parcubacteria bacterium]